MRLADPNPKVSLEEVQAILATSHAEIGNAKIKGPEETREALVYKIEASYGRKG